MDANEKLRQEIIEGLERTGLDATAVSRQIGKSKDFIRDFLQGRKRSLAQDAAGQIREVLAQRPASTPQDAPLGWRPPPLILGERDLPVFSAVEGGPGEMVISTDPIEFVPRPWFLREVKEGYAVVVTGESMVPVYEPGDMVIVNPRLPAIRNKNAIFVSGEEHGEFRATVKRLERSNAREWHVKQWNPPDGGSQELVLPKEQWPKALRIVGKYEGG